MGVIMIEVEPEMSEQAAENIEAGAQIWEGIKMPKAYPVYRCIQDIWDYKNTGQALDYLCLALTKDEIIEYGIQDAGGLDTDIPIPNTSLYSQKSYFRFIDDEKDIIVKLVGQNVILATLEHGDNQIPNPWGKVPAFVVSDLFSFEDPQFADSPVSPEMELAHAFLKGRSVRDLQKAYHGFAKAVEPLFRCQACGGSGLSAGNNGAGEGFNKGIPCPECTFPGASHGTGYQLRTKISDVGKIPIEALKDGNFDFKKIFGYVTPDIESWNKQDESINHIEYLIYSTYWGCADGKLEGYNGKQSVQETATKVLTDLQPKYARLNETADWWEHTENMIANLLGKYYYPQTFNQSRISLSRQYILETPQMVLDIYYGMKKNGMTDSMLDDQYRKYIKCLYQSNPYMQDICLKKFAVEPFPHLSAKDVEASEYVDEQDKVKKRYFGEWLETVEENAWLTLDRERLDTMLTDYSAKKQLKLSENDESESESTGVQPEDGGTDAED